MASFEYVRRKNKDVKRNRHVLYDGQLMRIANTSHDGLKLRREIVCHANDPSLTIVPDENYKEAIHMLGEAVEMLISNGENMWSDVEESESLDRHEISKIMRRIADSLAFDLRQLK